MASIFFPDTVPAKPEQNVRDRDFDWTDLDAGTTQAGSIGKVTYAFDALDLGREDLADWSGVNRIVGMAADARVDRTVVHAGATADAEQGLPQ